MTYGFGSEDMETTEEVLLNSPLLPDSPQQTMNQEVPNEIARVIYPFEANNPEKRNIYPKNVIVTSRYTIFSFIPKCLLEQFRRLANVYFLIIGKLT